jgi:hypothetical protein
MLLGKSAAFTNCPSQILHGQLSADSIQSSMLRCLNYGTSCFLFLQESFTFYYWKHIFDLTTYREFGIVNFWKPMLTFWELLTALTKEMYRNINLLMFSCIQLLMGVSAYQECAGYVSEFEQLYVVTWSERKLLHNNYAGLNFA